MGYGMAEQSTGAGAERRRGLRVPVRGEVVLHAERGPLYGTLENLSRGGVLVNVADAPERDGPLDLELRLPEGRGWVTGSAVRAEPLVRRWRVAIAFSAVGDPMREAIESSIHGALAAAQRRPILVIDDRAERRSQLIRRLSDRGMTPLAPRTPLEAIELLTRAQLHVDVCLLAPGFGVASTDLAAVLADSFPWVTTAEIDDDVDGTARRAVRAWDTSPVALIGWAVG